MLAKVLYAHQTYCTHTFIRNEVSNTMGACRDTCHKCIYCGTSCHIICGSETTEGGAVVCHCCQPHVHTVNAPSIRPDAGSISANTGIHNIDSLTTHSFTHSSHRQQRP